MTDTLSRLYFYLFGGFTIQRDGLRVPPPASQKARALLAYLLVHPGVAHERAYLAGLFWPDLSESVARRRLSQALWQVRQVCPDIETNRTTVRLPSLDSYWVDVEAFRGAMSRAASHEESLLSSLQEAVDLYQGDFLPGFYDDWTLVQREQLRQQYVLALQKLVQGYFQLGAYDQALEAGQRLINEEPLNEWAYEQVIRLCALLGRRDEAMRHYARLRRNLAEALGARPGPAIEQLMERVRAGAGVQPERRAPLFHDDITLPMIGRERAWERVRSMVDALRRDQGGACIVRGEAGIGKTRLLMELAQYAEGWGFPLWMSKAVQERASVPFQTLRQAITPHLTPLLVERLRLEMDPVWLAALAQVFPEIRAWTTDLATLPPLKKGEARSRFHQALIHLFRVVTARTALVLIFDDMQWADAASFDAIVAIAEATQRLPLLVAVSFRDDAPEHRRRLEAFLSSLPASAAIFRLGLLSANDAGRLVRVALGLQQPAPRFEQRLYQTTQGHPMFIIETLRALHDQGALYQDAAGHWSTPWDDITEDYRELPLSSRLQELFSQRLAQITPLARMVLQGVALVSRPVSFEFLQRLLDVSAHALFRALDELVYFHLLIFEGKEVRLVHDALADSISQLLTTEEIQAWHAKIANTLIALGDPNPAILAKHCTRGALWSEALHFHQLAARQALALSAFQDALEHLDQAIAIAERIDMPSAKRFDLVRQRELVLDVLGDRSRQEADLDLLLALADEPEKRAWVHLRRTKFFTDTGQFEQGEQAAQQGLTEARSEGLRHLELQIRLAENQLFVHASQYAQAWENAHALVALAQMLEDPIALAEAHRIQGDALLGLGRHAEVEPYLQQALAIYRQHQRRREEVEILHLMAILATEQGRIAQARSLYNEALTIASDIGFLQGEAKALFNLGNLEYLEGRYYHALAHYDAAGDLFRHLQNRRGIAIASLNRCAIILDLLGGDEEALQNIQEGLRIAQEIGDPISEAHAKSQLGAYLYHVDRDLVAAETHYRKAVDILLENHQLWMAQQDLLALAQVFIDQERYEEAIAALNQADALGQELGKEEPEWLSLILRAELHLKMGQPTQALRQAEQAVALLAQGRAQGGYKAVYVHARALKALGRHQEAAQEFMRAWELLQAALADFPEDLKAQSLERIALHRDIAQAYRELGRTLTKRLARADAPTGRPLRDDEWVIVRWTTHAPEDETIEHKVERRRYRLLRLLTEAAEQGAAPTVDDLAEALEASRATIKRDLAALRRAGMTVRTRGARKQR